MIPYKQLALAEVFEDCQNKFDNDKYQFLSLLDQMIKPFGRHYCKQGIFEFGR